MKKKNEPEKPEKITLDQQNLYNLNSFIVSNEEKTKLHSDVKIKLGNHSTRNLFSSEEKNNKKEVEAKTEAKKKYKPKILTGKLPLAFDINPKNKKEGKINFNLVYEDDSPKKLIKRIDEVDSYSKKIVCLTEGQGSPEIIKSKKQIPKIALDAKPIVR